MRPLAFMLSPADVIVVHQRLRLYHCLMESGTYSAGLLDLELVGQIGLLIRQGVTFASIINELEVAKDANHKLDGAAIAGEIVDSMPMDDQKSLVASIVDLFKSTLSKPLSAFTIKKSCGFFKLRCMADIYRTKLATKFSEKLDASFEITTPPR